MTRASIPDFSKEPWYHDFGDHRCPHDAWLDSIQILEPATGERHEIRKTEIIIRLLGAYHDGHIVFTYKDVISYTVKAFSSSQGHGDWMKDQITTTDGGLLLHRISWLRGASNATDWTIECGEIAYEWKPKEG